MIKELFRGVRKELSQMIYKAEDGAKLTEAFFNPWDAVLGKMAPTDFVAQVESNISWVYACVMVIAESMAMTPLVLKYRKGKDVITISDHVFLTTWTEVNPFMNNFELREITEIYQLLTGNAYWYIVKNKAGIPVEIWPVPAQYMAVVPDKAKFISGYIYKAPGVDPVAFAADEIVHFKYPNPNNVFYGVGPLFAAAYEVDNNTAMNQYQTTLFKNQAVPAGILSSDQVINKADSDRMREQWKQLYQGSNNAGKIAILSKGLKYDAIQLSAQELSYIQSKNVNRDSILGIFRVPKSLLGLVEDVNRANAEASEYTFNLHTIKPKLIRSQEKINEKIMPLYPQVEGAKLFVEYADPVPANRELEATERTGRLDKAITTVNEERARLGLPAVAWGDVPILPLTMAPFGSAPAAPAPEPVEESAKARSIRRAGLWAIYKARFDSEVYIISRKMKPLFKAQESEVQANLKKYFGKGFTKDAIDGILFDVEEWRKEFRDVIGPDIDAAYAAGAKSGEKMTGTNFNLDNPRTRKFLREKKLRFSFETNKSTTDALRSTLDEGLKAGETIKELSARVSEVFDFAEKYRSERIARTEVAECENRALYDTFKNAEADGKEWLHGGGGDNPRPEHVDLDGTVVGLDESFDVGGVKMQYPGDPSGGPDEICNCTCSMIPVMKR